LQKVSRVAWRRGLERLERVFRRRRSSRSNSAKASYVALVQIRPSSDPHEKNFLDLRSQLPQLDGGIYALATDLHERGPEQDVAVGPYPAM
jgi:hypothetical protein